MWRRPRSLLLIILSSWYFWAPSLVNDGSLASYATKNGYLDFAAMPNAPAGTLAPTTGFWVNLP